MSRTQDIEHSDIPEIGRIIRVMCVSYKLIYGNCRVWLNYWCYDHRYRDFLLKKSNPIKIAIFVHPINGFVHCSIANLSTPLHCTSKQIWITQEQCWRRALTFICSAGVGDIVGGKHGHTDVGQ